MRYDLFIESKVSAQRVNLDCDMTLDPKIGLELELPMP